MLGSIIGDVAGSIYEFDNIKTKDFELLAVRGAITDDSIMTCSQFVVLSPMIPS